MYVCMYVCMYLHMCLFNDEPNSLYVYIYMCVCVCAFLNFRSPVVVTLVLGRDSVTEADAKARLATLPMTYISNIQEVYKTIGTDA